MPEFWIERVYGHHRPVERLGGKSMSEMVERVARAIEPEAWDPDGFDRLPRPMKRARSLQRARAAIRAMRAPTTEMRMAAQPYPKRESAWRAMIDEALK
jgi:hypothetical protein